ncbi:hypothetical protein DNX69_09080 [Rhodopseudomonas palustris]|uniref:Uncharacterized protein n=1 Tax=Rhodopseudomonas palustris TaxID=1076 RepID=A0A323UWS2_RHOPL|nr:hypothetical protein [Rhodopseudomonas palustris]PZA12158.1 hypothetical protein DNX69_09080 [Rhodopseudomonas palustris]
MDASVSHSEQISWIKAKRDAIDMLASSLHGWAAHLEGAQRTEAHRAIAELLSIRTVFAERLDALASRHAIPPEVGDVTVAWLSKEWGKAHDEIRWFLLARLGSLSDDQLAVGTIDRKAEIKDVLEKLKQDSSAAIEQAKRDLDETLGRIAAEQVRLGTFSTSSDKALKSIKATFERTREQHDRTWQSIAEICDRGT